jgi:hypothetical protein
MDIVNSDYFQEKLNTYFANKSAEITAKAVQLREIKKLKAKNSNIKEETAENKKELDKINGEGSGSDNDHGDA